MQIDIIDETQRLTAEQTDLVFSILNHASEYIALSGEVECSVTFVDNARIQEINRDYRQKDMPTDVISFALDDEIEDEILPQLSGFEDVVHHLGDIIVSVDKMIEQAQEYNHSVERELGFLVVHGFLHLNGYDHMTSEDEEEMFSLQQDILDDFGLSRG